ncbi:MAG: hypothetical protein ACYC0V_00295 [Armatimonadota bacterium]
MLKDIRGRRLSLRDILVWGPVLGKPASKAEGIIRAVAVLTIAAINYKVTFGGRR